MGLAAGHLQAGRLHRRGRTGRRRACARSLKKRGRTSFRLPESLVKVKSPEALAACEAAVKAAPDSAVAHASLGEALIAAGRDAEAEAPLKRTLELDPKQSAASAQLARVLAAKGDHAGTIAAANQALAADPGRKDLYALRGRAYLATGDQAKALAGSLRRCGCQSE